MADGIGVFSIGTGAALTAGAILAANQSSKIKGAITGIETQIANIENRRRQPVDPSSFISDTSSFLSNPYANLSVATKAAEMQMQETDKALANTLDTLRATGASAGGATALALAAIKGKQGVTASIEQQEATNEKLRAQGEQTLMAAQQAEAQRLQQANLEGYKWKYAEDKEEDLRQLDRQQALLDEQKAQQLAIQQGIVDSIGGTMGAVGTFAGAIASQP